MATGRDQVLAEIETQWNQLAEIIARVPTHRMEGEVVVGTWSVKDLLGHIVTWESETIGNIQRYLDPNIGTMQTYPDPDGFNDEKAIAKRASPLRGGTGTWKRHTQGCWSSYVPCRSLPSTKKRFPGASNWTPTTITRNTHNPFVAGWRLRSLRPVQRPHELCFLG